MATVAMQAAQSTVTTKDGTSAIDHFLTLPLADDARLGRRGGVQARRKTTAGLSTDTQSTSVQRLSPAGCTRERPVSSGAAEWSNEHRIKLSYHDMSF